MLHFSPILETNNTTEQQPITQREIISEVENCADKIGENRTIQRLTSAIVRNTFKTQTLS